MSNIDLTKSPEADAKDILTKLFRAGVKAVPFVGGSLDELMSILIVPSLDKRTKVWLESIAAGLIDVQKKLHNFEFENLHENENFTTAFMHASASAIKNHQKEKLEALKNAVLNSTTMNAPSEDLQLIFINYIDLMTQWHLRILNFFNDPEAWLRKNDKQKINQAAGSLQHIIFYAYPKLQGYGELSEKIIKDLYNYGFIEFETIHGIDSVSKLYQKRTTNLGVDFIKFITSPI